MNKQTIPGVLQPVESTNPDKGCGIHPSAGALVFLCGYHLSRYRQDGERYYGTEQKPTDDIPVGNTIAQFAQHHFGLDFDDVKSPWGAFAATATAEDLSRALLTTTMEALVNAGAVSAEHKLFVVLFEYPFPDDFFNHPQPDAGQVSFWDESMMTVDAGWDEVQAAQLAQMRCEEALMTFGDFYHSIVRIR